MARITINNISFDPEAHAPALAAAGMLSPNSAHSDYILVQMRESLTSEQQEQLAGVGATVLEHVPEQTYLCRYQASDLGPIRALPFVAWANVYMTELKLKPGLHTRTPGATAALLALRPQELTGDSDPVTVDVVLQKGVDPDALRTEVATAASVDPASIDVGTRKLRLTAERRHLPTIAALDAVRHIEEFVPPKLANNVARRILAVEPPLASRPLTAANQIVAVCDTGLDTGVISTIHPAFTGRVNKLYAMGRSTSDDPAGHGTHVAGSVLGHGSSATLGKINGAAPDAKLVFQSVLDSAGGLNGISTDLHDLFGPPYRDDDARIHTNSWGAPVNGDYSSHSQELDDFVWNHRDLVICVAAGNEGKDTNGSGVIAPSSIGAPGSAKNCITIGASENNRQGYCYGGTQPARTYGDILSNDYPVEPIKSGALARNPDGVVPFSSRGPAHTNRTKPDVVAPGTAILSAKSTRAPVPTADDWGASSDPLYMYEGGTSMATPLVAGCAAVVREWLISKFANAPAGKPTAALVKAVLINTAVPLDGQFNPPECGPRPDNSQGYGRVNLAPLSGLEPYRPVVFDEDVALTTGGQHSIATVEFPAPAGGVTLTATIAWTDPAGEALQNDLDLTVEALDREGNVISSASPWHGNKPAGNPDFDRENNVEQVCWPGFPGAKARLTITAHRTLQPQSFALVYRVGRIFPGLGDRPMIAGMGTDHGTLTLTDEGTVPGRSDLTGALAIAQCFTHGMALLGNGAVRVWKNNIFPNSIFDVTEAMNVPNDLTDVVGIAAAWEQFGANPAVIGVCFAVKADGTAVSWGGYPDANLPTPPTSSLRNIVAVACACGPRFGYLCLCSDGTVLDLDQRGIARVAPHITDVIAIANSPRGRVALRRNGTVVTWRGTTIDATGLWGLPGTTGQPQGVRDVVAISAGLAHVIALRSDGTVVAWGSNEAGECDVPAGLSDVVAINTAVQMNYALKRSSQLVTWGRNTNVG